MSTNQTPNSDAEQRHDARPDEAGKQEALRASELRYRRLFESVQDGILILDADTGMIVDVNPFLVNLLGYSRDVFLTKKVWELGFLGDAIANEDKFRELQVKGYVRYEDLPLETSDGRRLEVEFVSNVYQVNEHRVIQYNIRDITERKQAEEAQADQARRLDYTLQGTNVGTWEWNVQTGATVFNERWADIIGYTLEEISPVSIDTWMKFCHPDDLKESDRLLQACFSGESEYYHCECRMRHKSGEWVWVLDRGKVATWTEDGKPEWMYGTHQDITARKRAEEALRESETHLQGLFETMAEGVIRIVPDGQILQANPAAERILGLKRSDIEARNYVAPEWEILRPDGTPMPPEEMAGPRAMKERRLVKDVVMGVKRPDGSIVWISVSAAPMMTESGELEGVVATFVDITERKQAEEASRTKHHLIQTILASTPSPFVLKDVNSVYLTVNRAFCEFIGKTEEEIIGKTDYDLFPADVAEQYIAGDKAVMSGGQQQKEEWQVPNASDVIWMKVVKTPVHNEEGECNGIVCSVTDISQFKQTEEAVQREREKAERYLDIAGVMLATVNADEKITLINQKGCEILGYNEEELVGENWFDLLVPREIRKEIRGIFAKLMSGDIEPVEYYENPLLTKNGEQRLIAFHNTVIRDSSGQIVGALFSGEDITERKRAEEALRESEARFRELAELLPVVAFETDGHNRLTYVNRKAYELFAYSPADFDAGLDGFCMIVESEREHARDRFARRLKGEDLGMYEYTGLRKDGSTFPILLQTVPIRRGDRVVGSRGIVVDITEQRSMESQLRQAQKLESIGTLAGGVAHDFNNMLGIILGHADLILEEMDPDHPFHDGLTEIKKAGERSADLTRQLLAFARKQTVAPEVLDLNQSMEGMLKMLHRLIGEDIDMAWIPGEAVWPVKIDPGQIDQILANLCVNARDAIAGVGKVTIETGNKVFDEDYCKEHAGFLPGEYTLLAVSDNGCGMDTETLEKVFEPFITTKELDKGTGLGLSTVYGAVKQNNGFVNVYSEPGQGTTIKIYLPRHAARAAETKESRTQAAERGSETILLVEDEPAILKMTTRVLEQIGYKVLAAGTPGEAIALAREHAGEIHLLVTDVVMPEMNGRDLAKNILSLYPGLKRLFMSGYTANVIAHHGVLDEGVHFIQKPFSIGDLTAKVREALEA